MEMREKLEKEMAETGKQTVPFCSSPNREFTYQDLWEIHYAEILETNRKVEWAEVSNMFEFNILSPYAYAFIMQNPEFNGVNQVELGFLTEEGKKSKEEFEKAKKEDRIDELLFSKLKDLEHKQL